MLLVAEVLKGIIAPAVLTDASAAVATTSAVDAIDSCQTLVTLLLLRPRLSTWLCVCYVSHSCVLQCMAA